MTERADASGCIPSPGEGKGLGLGLKPLLMKKGLGLLEHPSRRLGPQRRRVVGTPKPEAWQNCYLGLHFKCCSIRYSRKKTKISCFVLLFARLIVLCRFAAKIGCASGTKINWGFILCSSRLSLSLASPKILTLEKENKNINFCFAFRSLNRIFAPYYNSILTKQRYYGNNSREHE